MLAIISICLWPFIALSLFMFFCSKHCFCLSDFFLSVRIFSSVYISFYLYPFFLSVPLSLYQSANLHTHALCLFSHISLSSLFLSSFSFFFSSWSFTFFFTPYPPPSLTLSSPFPFPFHISNLLPRSLLPQSLCSLFHVRSPKVPFWTMLQHHK